MPRPDLSRVPEFYHKYISLVKEDELKEAFINGSGTLIKFLENIPADKREYRYAENKWNIKEVIQHIIDTERVFNYRTLCFARQDQTPLPGFDENEYSKNSKARNRDWNGLLEEFKSVRKSTELLFASFDEEQLNAAGIANKNSNYVLGMGYIMVGHGLHHLNVIKERYL